MVSGLAYAYDGDGNVAKRREVDGATAYTPYREYQLVRYGNSGANGVQLSAGDVVVGDCVSDDGITVDVVSATSSPDAVRGVVVSVTIPTCDVTGSTAQTDYGRRNWGYIQTKGFCQKINMTTGLLAGGSVVASSGSPRYAGAPTYANQRSMGFAYSSSTAGSSNTVDLNL